MSDDVTVSAGDSSRNDSVAPSCAAGGCPFRRWLPVILIVLLALITYESVTNYALIGFDSYPLILTSRIRSGADFVGTFTEKLMDGRYGRGDFYRPLLNLSFAVDYFLWRLRPTGYQLTNLACAIGCAVALYALLRRALGGGVWLAPMIAAMAFVLHPSLYEVVPVSPRRAETMCGLFMLLSLWAQLSPRALSRRRPPILPAIFAMLAIASKEAALVLPAMSFAAVLLFSERRGIVSRILHAIVAVIPLAVVDGLMLAVRYRVIGGLGGHPKSGEATLSENWASAIDICRQILYPQPVMLTGSMHVWLPILLLAALIVVCVLVLLRLRSTTGTAGCEARAGRTAILSLVWLAVVVGLYAWVGELEAWYYLLPVIGLTMLMGAVLGRAVACLQAGGTAERVAAVPVLALMLILIGWQARYSPLIYKYDEYKRATTASNLFLDAIKPQIEQAQGGTIIRTPPTPVWLRKKPEATAIRGVAVLNDYSVQAWAELNWPDHRIRVRTNTGDPKPAPDEILIQFTRMITDF